MKGDKGGNIVVFKVIGHGAIMPLPPIFHVKCGIFDWLKKPKYFRKNH